jgi:hypothetical protein
MSNWSDPLLERIEGYLDRHEYWKWRSDAKTDVLARRNALHLAVFVQPFLQFVLDGRKTVESRFSINRCPPYESVEPQDLVLVKQSGGPVVAVAEVSDVWYYELDTQAREVIRSRFANQLCVDGPDFWESKAAACYATLMRFSRVERIEPIPCLKRDRRGWVVLEPSIEQLSLFEAPSERHRRSV